MAKVEKNVKKGVNEVLKSVKNDWVLGVLAVLVLELAGATQSVSASLPVLIVAVAGIFFVGNNVGKGKVKYDVMVDTLTGLFLVFVAINGIVAVAFTKDIAIDNILKSSLNLALMAGIISGVIGIAKKLI